MTREPCVAFRLARFAIPEGHIQFWCDARFSSSSPARVNRRFVSFVRDHCTKWLVQKKPVVPAGVSGLGAALAVALFHLRHPTRRGVALAAAALPALFLLYVLVLIPFTPSIGDIRMARVDEPAQIMSADGKLLAEFKPANREWVTLSEISSHMADALIATEDHRFYQHRGLEWRRTHGFVEERDWLPEN